MRCDSVEVDLLFDEMWLQNTPPMLILNVNTCHIYFIFLLFEGAPHAYWDYLFITIDDDYWFDGV